MKRATVSALASLVAGVGVLAACGGGSALSEADYRAEVERLCESPVRNLSNRAPTLDSRASEVQDWAQSHRDAAIALRALEGPRPEEDDGRKLARTLDEMANELDAMAAAIEAQDGDALSDAVGAGVRVRSRVIASCVALERFGA